MSKPGGAAAAGSMGGGSAALVGGVVVGAVGVRVATIAVVLEGGWVVPVEPPTTPVSVAFWPPGVRGRECNKHDPKD